MSASGARACWQRLEPQQRGAALAQGRAAHGLEQPLDHALDDLEEHAVARAIADCERHAGLLGEAPAGFLDARDVAVLVEGDDARADVDGREVDDLAALAHGDLGGAAADIDVHDAGALADRARGRARAEGGERRLERVAGADGDELARLPGEQLADGAGVAPAHGDAGQDQRARVDRRRDRARRAGIARR